MTEKLADEYKKNLNRTKLLLENGHWVGNQHKIDFLEYKLAEAKGLLNAAVTCIKNPGPFDKKSLESLLNDSDEILREIYRTI